MPKEQEFRAQLAQFKKNYIAGMLDDLKCGGDLSMIEIDGFQSYLMIASDFPTVPNKEAILAEFGFSLLPENHVLRLNEVMLDRTHGTVSIGTK